jgi:hypothetical protein
MSSFLRYMHDMLLIQSMMFDDVWLQHALSEMSADERDGTADSELARPPFDLAAISDERFQLEFRFEKKDMPRLLAALGVPDIITVERSTLARDGSALYPAAKICLSEPPC